MKTRIITLLLAISAIIIGGATAQQYDRKMDLYKNGTVVKSYDITDIDSLKFRRIDYVKAEYKVLPSGTGNVTIDGSTTTPKYVVPGTNVTYVATAKSGYKFKGWNMEGVEISTSNTLILPINSNTEITAVFQNIPNYSVTVVSSGNGTAVASKSSVQEGGSVTLTATPNSGYVFKNWTLNGNVVSTQNPYTATVTANSVYVANFEKKTYTISVSSGGGGTAVASKSSVQGGGTVILTATPNSGYVFKNWTLNGNVVSTQNPYTATVTANSVYVANFEKKTYTISVSSGEGGTAVASKSSVQGGGTVILTATPNSGYVFKNWTLNGNVVSTQNPYTAIVTANSVYVANFEKTYTISVSSGGGGTAVASKSSVQEGGSVTLTATPNSGYVFKNWTLNGNVVSTQNPYTATVTANSVYVANFVLPTNNGHAYVDLGLSVKWATCNVGATTPEEYGDYFAWGETTPKTTSYNWSTYKYCNGTSDSMTKYCTDSEYGIVDNKTTLELSDDAAHVNWGGNWRMPTFEEIDELRNTNNCTWTWTTQNRVNGYKVTSKKNGNSIFLPAAGYRDYSSLDAARSYGYYWSSSLVTYHTGEAYDLYFYSSFVGCWYYRRYVGRSVRPVFE